MQYAVAQVGAVCKTHPVTSKILIAPALTVGHDLMAAVTLSEQSWMNVQVHTPRSLAEQDAGSHLIAKGWTQLTQDADLFLIDEWIPKIVRQMPDDVFAQQASNLARSFLRTFHALRATGIEADRLGPGNPFLKTLYRAYCEALAQGQHYDNAVLYQHAIAQLETRPITQEVQYLILDETPLSELAWAYLKTRTHGDIHRIGRKDHSVALPMHCAGMRFKDHPVLEAVGQVGIGAQLVTSGLCPENNAQIQLRETLGLDTEVRAIFRDMRFKKMSLDTVEIVYTAQNPYLTILYNLVKQYDLPATFSSGIPLGFTQTGQALTAFCRWMGSGFDATEWIRLCRSGLIAFSDPMNITPQELATLIYQARISEGRSHYFDALERMKTSRLERMSEEDWEADRDGVIAQIEAAQRVLKQVFDLIPDGNVVSVSDVINASTLFLYHFVIDQTETDREARQALLDRLQALAVSPQRGPLRRLASRLSDLLSGITFGAKAAKPGHLAIGPLDRAGYTGRSHTYIVGMDEGSFPGGSTEDPLLLDGDRAGLSEELALHRTRPAEQVYHFARVLGMAPGQLTLSSTRKSLADGRENYPSALFLQAAEQMAIKHVPVVRAIADSDSVALDDTDALLAVHRAPNYADVIQQTFAWLTAGLKAQKARDWNGLTIHDGWLGHPTPELAITGERTIYSPSRLETLARCPYRYFLRYVLEIFPHDKHEEDPTRWLNPLSFGSLLHDVFKNFMVILQDRGESPDREKHAPLMHEVLHKEITAKQETDPIIHQAAFRADVKRLERATQVFLAVESEQVNVRPVGFEVSFGFGETEELNQEKAVPVKLSNDVQFRIKGRIDRVDQIGDDFAIWDYKTGSMAQYDERDLLKRGTHLQWALYAYALDVVLKQQQASGQVIQSGYVFPGDREHGRKVSAKPPTPEALATVLRPLFALAANGGFFHIQKEHECAYCPYNRLCEKERIGSDDLVGIREAMEDESHFETLLDNLNQWMGV